MVVVVCLYCTCVFLVERMADLHGWRGAKTRLGLLLRLTISLMRWYGKRMLIEQGGAKS